MDDKLQVSVIERIYNQTKIGKQNGITSKIGLKTFLPIDFSSKTKGTTKKAALF